MEPGKNFTLRTVGGNIKNENNNNKNKNKEYMNNKSFEFKIGVIGLGYVGTPLACLFSKKYDTWGYDINAAKVDKLARKQGAEEKCYPKHWKEG